jgi:hypothetical protein
LLKIAAICRPKGLEWVLAEEFGPSGFHIRTKKIPNISRLDRFAARAGQMLIDAAGSPGNNTEPAFGRLPKADTHETD